MPQINALISDQLRGAILEEIVLYLLEIVGYRIVQAGEEGTQNGSAGLMVRGRGEWHQIDALAAFDGSPAFMYPFRLTVEAKCFRHDRVGIGVVRNAVGTLKDITENYFSLSPVGRNENGKIQVQRFNYHAAVFSTSGYSKPAQRYAIAHQIFLIQYKRIFLMEPIIEALMDLRKEHFKNNDSAVNVIKSVRRDIRDLLHDRTIFSQERNGFSDEGINYFIEYIANPLFLINGSYYGMLQGRWPLHLLSESPLPEEIFRGRDTIRCKVYSYESDPSKWYFSPVEYEEGNNSWFKLGFDLPEDIARIVNRYRHERSNLADLKRVHFSFLDLSGKIGGIQRQVRLELDEEWLNRFISSISRRRSN